MGGSIDYKLTNLATYPKTILNMNKQIENDILCILFPPYHMMKLAGVLNLVFVVVTKIYVKIYSDYSDTQNILKKGIKTREV